MLYNNMMDSKKTWVVNIIGGPGVGKTTISALVFAKLKISGLMAEYVQEYAKRLVWTKDFDTLNNQHFVTKCQFELLDQINGHVDVIVTDGPLIHGIYYNKFNKDNMSNVDKVEDLILECIHKFNNINIVLERGDHEYETEGRIQTEKEARDIDTILRHIMHVNKLNYTTFETDPNKVDDIVKFIRKKITE